FSTPTFPNRNAPAQATDLTSFSSATALAVASRQSVARSTRGKDHVECIDQGVAEGDGDEEGHDGAVLARDRGASPVPPVPIAEERSWRNYVQARRSRQYDIDRGVCGGGVESEWCSSGHRLHRRRPRLRLIRSQSS